MEILIPTCTIATDLELRSQLLVSLQYNRLEKVSLRLEEVWDAYDEDLGDFPTHRRSLGFELFPRYLAHTIQEMNLERIMLPSLNIVQLDSWPSLTKLSLVWCENVAPMLSGYRSSRLTTFEYRGLNERSDDSEEMGAYLKSISAICLFFLTS